MANKRLNWRFNSILSSLSICSDVKNTLSDSRRENILFRATCLLMKAENVQKHFLL
mgnify:CR=1 FL=1